MKRNQRSELLSAGLLLAPVLVLMSSLVFYPIAETALNSLHDMNLIHLSEKRFVGLANYIKTFHDQAFQDALVNTGVILILLLIICSIASLFEANLLNRKGRLSSILTAVAIVPWALPPLVNGIIWRFIFYPGYGLLNKILIALSLIDKPILWATDRWSTLLIASFTVAWRVVPFCAIVLLAHLQMIDDDIIEAAQVDGASGLQIFMRIKLPLLFPAFVIVLTNIMIAGFNVFDELVALIAYREMGQSVMIYNYSKTFAFLDFGWGSAISYIIMLASGFLAYLNISQKHHSLRGIE